MQMYSVHTMPYLRAKTVLRTIYAYSGASFLTLFTPPPRKLINIIFIRPVPGLMSAWLLVSCVDFFCVAVVQGIMSFWY